MLLDELLGQDINHIFKVSELEQMSADEHAELGWKCCTDLFFLANNICRSPNQKKYKPLLKRVHGGICDALVQKDPNKPLEDWSPIKQRVILSSRGTLKSVIEAIDIVQIILCYPDARILTMSGTLGKAQSILEMARAQFQSNEALHFLFPSFCEGIHVSAEEFTSPARKDYTLRDPTIKVATFGSVKAGWHGEWIKLDDATNEINQATPELVLKSIGHYDDLDPLLEPGGYVDFTATRWAIDDLPEYIRRNAEEMEQESGQKEVLYFYQPIWTVKKVADEHPDWTPTQITHEQAKRDEREKKYKLNADDVELLWPEKLTAKYLWPKYRKNPRNFAAQYLLNPEGMSSGVFTHALLVKQTKGLEYCPLPHQSAIYINWDLSGVSGHGDFAVGMVGIWELATKRLFIIDGVVDKFTSSTEICNAILRLFKKYNPDYHRIESSGGAELLGGELRALAQQAGLEKAFYPGWDPPSNEKDAKVTRIKLLTGALERNEMQFFSGMECLPELYKQLETWTGKKTGKQTYNDDVPDCIAQMWQKYKDGVSVKSIGYLTPSGAVVDFQSSLPAKEEEVDTHADERANADLEFLMRFTAPHAGMGI